MKVVLFVASKGCEIPWYLMGQEVVTMSNFAGDKGKQIRNARQQG